MCFGKVAARKDGMVEPSQTKKGCPFLSAEHRLCISSNSRNNSRARYDTTAIPMLGGQFIPREVDETSWGRSVVRSGSRQAAPTALLLTTARRCLHHFIMGAHANVTVIVSSHLWQAGVASEKSTDVAAPQPFAAIPACSPTRRADLEKWLPFVKCRHSYAS